MHSIGTEAEAVAFRFSEYSPNNDGNDDDDDDDGGDNDDDDDNNNSKDILLFHIPRDQLHRYCYYTLQRLYYNKVVS